MKNSLRISGLIGAAPEMAKRELPKPAACLSFFLNTFDSPGILRPILKIAFESIAALRFEYIFSYILGTLINR